MNFTESFEQFSSRLTTTDLALYAGIGLLIWVFFREKLSPVQQIFSGLIEKAKSFLSQKKSKGNPLVIVPTVNPTTATKLTDHDSDNEDIFFKLILSWKQTRDLAVASRCEEAVKVADEMFPYLSPVGCGKEKE